MSWLWITLGVTGAGVLLAAVVCAVAPLDVWVLVERFETAAARADLRWGWGAVTGTVRWWPGVLDWRVRLVGRALPRGPLERIAGKLKAWLDERSRDREPFDWRALLQRERIAAELAALRAGADRFESSEAMSRLGLDSADLLLDLGSSLGLRSRVDLRVGLEDPFALGLVWAAGAVAAGLLPPGSFALAPAFDDGDTVEGFAEVRGRLRPLPLAWLVIRFVFFTRSGWRCLGAVWTWWWYPRDAAEAAPRSRASSTSAEA